jgi:adenylate cyclase
VRATAKFCDECGSPITAAPTAHAEYKQVTVLFADVVHSMDIAAAALDQLVNDPQRDDGIALLATAREAALQERFTMGVFAFIDTHLANEKTRVGDLDGAIELSRAAIEAEYASGEMVVRAATVAALVEALLRRRGPTDLEEAQAAIDRLATVPTEPGFVANDIWLLRMRALEAQARGGDAGYREYRDRYRTMANSLGFEGHIAWAGAMT